MCDMLPIQTMNLDGFCMNTKDCLCICVDTKIIIAVIEADGAVKIDYVQAPNEHERINDPKMREGAHFQLTKRL